MENEFMGFPTDNIDPKLKTGDWILKVCKAVVRDKFGINPISSNAFSNNAEADVTKSYTMGQQNTDKFKKTPLGTDIKDQTWMATDFEPIAIIPKFVEMMSAQMLQREYDVQAFAVDPLSVSEEDLEFNKLKIKTMMREAAKGTELQDHPLVKQKHGEPSDLEELQISRDEYSFKSELAVNAEEVISLVLQYNKSDEKRKTIVESIMDDGIGMLKVWLDDKGMVRFKALPKKGLTISYCEERDFSDRKYVGHYSMVLVDDLAPWFSPKEMEEICRRSVTQYGNPGSFSPGDIAKFKCLVLDLEYVSFDYEAYKKEINSKGNEDFLQVDYSYSADKYVVPNGMNEEPKFIRQTKKELYKAKYIVNTDLVYDYGKVENQSRRLSSWWDVKSDFILYAWKLHNMSLTSFTKRLIPFADRYQSVWQKIQNIDAKTIPYVMNINFSALEKVAWGANGSTWKPDKILDFVLQNYAAVFRTESLTETEKQGFSPIAFQSTPQLTIIAQLLSELQFILTQMYEISGLNQAVAGNPESKMLTTGLNMQQQATNNALYLMSEAEKEMYFQLADTILLKVQVAIKLGKTDIYSKALGKRSVKIFELKKDVGDREFGIFLHDAPTKEQRLELYQEMNAKDSMGLLNIGDKAIIDETRNIKSAWRILGYRIKKREQELQAQKLQAIQMQSQSNAQAGVAVEQAKQQTMKQQGDINMQIENMKGQWQYMIEQMKKGSDENSTTIQANSRVIAAKIIADSKNLVKGVA